MSILAGLASGVILLWWAGAERETKLLENTQSISAHSPYYLSRLILCGARPLAAGAALYLVMEMFL